MFGGPYENLLARLCDEIAQKQEAERQRNEGTQLKVASQGEALRRRKHLRLVVSRRPIPSEK